MKLIFNLLIAAVFVFLGARLSAQEPKPQVGFIRFVHAIAPGEGTATVLIDGENIFPKGYAMGQRTGGIGIKAGSHTVAVRKNGVKEGSTKFDLKNGETLSLIAFAQKIPPKEEGDPVEWEIKILRLKQSDAGKGYNISFISVCDKEDVRVETLSEGQTKPKIESVKRLTTTTLKLGAVRGEAQVSVDGEVVTMVSPDDPGNYVVVLYQDAEGKIKSLSFFDPKFVIAG
jgi:hypothetical protein